MIGFVFDQPMPKEEALLAWQRTLEKTFESLSPIIRPTSCVATISRGHSQRRGDACSLQMGRRQEAENQYRRSTGSMADLRGVREEEAHAISVRFERPEARI